ncbi:MAG: type II CAAX endopeptidase family protein [Candidatus Acidiferrales bacterium]
MVSDITPNASSTPGPGARHSFFLGSSGLRAGWRILMFCGIALGLVFAVYTGVGVAATLSRSVRDWTVAVQANTGILNAIDQIVIEGIVTLAVIVAAAIMTLIEKRTFTDYRLPWNQAFGKRFWQGVPLGFAMLSLLLTAIWALQGFSLAGLAETGVAALKYGLLWAIAFFLVGVFEDFTFRGYLQSALEDGIGFWPAAIVLAVVFGAIHWNNKGEALFGCVMAGSFGFLEAFALKRTGSLWLLIGMHASWDWGETYFYGTPDSGVVGGGHLFNSSFHGAKWLTGGTVGPEGSWLVYAVLLIWALAIHLLFPAKHVPQST